MKINKFDKIAIFPEDGEDRKGFHKGNDRKIAKGDKKLNTAFKRSNLTQKRCSFTKRHEKGTFKLHKIPIKYRKNAEVKYVNVPLPLMKSV